MHGQIKNKKKIEVTARQVPGISGRCHGLLRSSFLCIEYKDRAGL